MKNYIQNGNYLDAKVTGTKMDSGEGRVIGEMFGVAVADIPVDGTGAIAIEGVYEFDKSDSDAGVTQFAAAYWDATNKEATSESSGNRQIGVFAEAAVTAATKAKVLLGEGLGGKDEMVVTYSKYGAGSLPTGSGTGQVFFIAPVAMKVLKVSAVFSVENAAALTADIHKDTGTNAPGAGSAVLLGSTKLNLAGTANTVQSPNLSATAASLLLAAGDRLSFRASGAGTEIANVVVTVHMARA